MLVSLNSRIPSLCKVVILWHPTGQLLGLFSKQQESSEHSAGRAWSWRVISGILRLMASTVTCTAKTRVPALHLRFMLLVSR